uniref:Uncharacterized protein n=1 Tax=Dendroctonus ponderosae TaxID=77166 RepID=A0AAR5QHB8_DENPD
MKISKVFVCFLLVWAPALAGTIEIKCPEFCACDIFQGLKRATCQSRKLVSIELNIPAQAEILDISHNQISKLGDKIFLADAEINQSTFEAGRNRIMEMSRTCDENPATAVDQKALEKYLESNGPDPANAGVHALCITKNLSWQNEDGSVNKSLITEKVKAIFGGVDAKIERYIEDCTEAKAKPEDTAEQLLNCYRKHSPKTE